MRVVSILFLFLLLPLSSRAAVTFSEVAWMGTTVSANHEWLELHNDGSAVDVTGWVITDGMNLQIELTGVIPANSYTVLERTSDDTITGTAFLIYTGALVNTGATLSLKRTDGSVEDQVSGGEGWQNIGGDNVSKETAQYTTGGWATAAATPGRAVVANEVTVAAANQPTTTHAVESGGTHKKANASAPIVLTLPDVTLQLEVKAQLIGYVHQLIKMDVQPSGIGDTLIDSLQYEWNFGDGATSSEKEPAHLYDYPGTYVITVYGGFKRQEQVARHEITILPVTVSLTTNGQGDVQVNNDSPYELDISGYSLVGDHRFVFSPRTIILPNQTITIPKRKLGKTVEQVTILYDTKGTAITSIMPRSLSGYVDQVVNDDSYVAQESVTIPALLTVRPETDFLLSSTDQVEEMQPSVTNSVQTESVEGENQQAAVVTYPISTNERWPYVALAVVMLLATLGLYVAPHRNEN